MIAPIADEKFVTLGDLKDLKILLLTFVAMNAFNLIKWLLSLFWGDQVSIKKKVDDLEDSNSLILQKLENISEKISVIKDSQLTESDVRNIYRNEHDFIEKVKNRN